MLYTYILMIALGWSRIFTQERTLSKAITRLFCGLLNPGRNTISQSIIFSGKQHSDWSNTYKFYSRSDWNPLELFDVVVKETIPYFDSDYITIAADDTKIKKTGKKIPKTQYYRDPLSPAFHANFLWGHRILQFSALLPLYKQYHTADFNETGNYNSSRGVPVRIINASSLKKPGKKAAPEEHEAYRQAKKAHNMSITYNEMVRSLRKKYDENGASEKRILMTVDGSFCNKVVFTANIERTDTVARCRKDASLCFKSTDTSKRFYEKEKFNPYLVYQDDKIDWQHTHAIIGKRYRQIRYKELSGIYWQRGAGRKPLRLIVIAPRPYKTTKTGKTYYKEQAYILTDNLALTTETIIQEYINRWEIEVNHRDEKTVLGLGEAQVWNEKSVEKHPAHLVASYSILLLASLKCFGMNRGEQYIPLPKWRKNTTRPSCNDLINILMKELHENKDVQKELNLDLNSNSICCINY